MSWTRPPRPAKQLGDYTPRPRAAACVMEGVVARAVVAVPKSPPVRDETYRRLVAALPCIRCKVDGYSQAAHTNTGKGMAMKASDDDCFPLCSDRPGVMGCHTWFDQHALFTRQERRDREQRWARETRQKLGRAS